MWCYLNWIQICVSVVWKDKKDQFTCDYLKMMIWKDSKIELSRQIYHLEWQPLKVKIQGNILMENQKNSMK
jgi:hypothetical protein